MSVTIKDLARETGLGLATISAYLNGKNVREKNRIKIEAAIKKYNFQVNEVARGLKKNESMTIGFVIPEMNNSFFAEIITSVTDYLRIHGYAVITCDCRTDKNLERDAINFLIRKRVDGIINVPVNADGSHLAPYLELDKPVVIIDRKIPGLKCDFVLVDNIEAIQTAANKLILNGHTKIGLVGGPTEVYTAEERTLGYRLALLNAGIVPEERFISHCDYTIRDGRDSMLTLLKRNPDMTAAIAINYETTVGAIIALNECGKVVGKDISMVGFDNADFAKACNPTLDIVIQPTEEIGRNVVKCLMARLDGKTTETQTKILKTTLLDGKSIKNIRQ